MYRAEIVAKARAANKTVHDDAHSPDVDLRGDGWASGKPGGYVTEHWCCL